MPKGIQSLLNEAQALIATYDAAEAMERLAHDTVIFIDVRDAPELHQDGQIPGAIHASRGMLEYHIDASSPYHKTIFTAEKEFIFYCKSGGRSLLAAQRAQEMGVKRVASLSGGFLAWQAQGGQVGNAERAQ